MLGAQLRSLRKVAGVTQEQLAEAIGATQKELSEYERGESFPRPERLEEIARMLGVQIHELFMVRPKPKPRNPDLAKLLSLIELHAHDSTYLRQALRLLRAIA
jgi:transcriptional regulator with XRE-family HTH domain